MLIPQVSFQKIYRSLECNFIKIETLLSLAKYSFLIAKFMIFIIVKSRYKTCSKIKKTLDLLVH